jgi:hypothetical protein
VLIRFLGAFLWDLVFIHTSACRVRGAIAVRSRAVSSAHCEVMWPHSAGANYTPTDAFELCEPLLADFAVRVRTCRLSQCSSDTFDGVRCALAVEEAELVVARIGFVSAAPARPPPMPKSSVRLPWTTHWCQSTATTSHEGRSATTARLTRGASCLLLLEKRGLSRLGL